MDRTIIYRYGGPAKGEIRLYKRNRFRFIPAAFIFGGMFGLFLTISPFAYLEAKYRLIKPEPVAPAEVVKVTSPTSPKSFSQLLTAPDQEIFQPSDAQFSIVIPKIGVNSRILANINPYDDGEYQGALKLGAAHAAGTYLPGEGGTIFIFGHSTNTFWNVSRFNAIFYLLKEVEKGDEIDISYQGIKYIYKVTDKIIVSADANNYLRSKGNGEELILQTCYPPGTTWQRLLVFAKPENNLSQNL